MLTPHMLRQVVEGAPANEVALKLVADAVNQQWETHTRRAWGYMDSFQEEVTLDDPRDQYFWLRRYPVVNLLLVEYRERDGTWIAVDAEAYDFSGRVGRIERLEGDRWSGRTLRVTAEGGIEVPADALRAMVTQAKFLLQRGNGSNVMLRSQGYAGGSTNLLDADLHPEFELAIRNYERHV